MKQPLKAEFLQVIVSIKFPCRFRDKWFLPYLPSIFGVFERLNSMGYQGKSTEVGL